MVGKQVHRRSHGRVIHTERQDDILVMRYPPRDDSIGTNPAIKVVNFPHVLGTTAGDVGRGSVELVIVVVVIIAIRITRFQVLYQTRVTGVDPHGGLYVGQARCDLQDVPLLHGMHVSGGFHFGNGHYRSTPNGTPIFVNRRVDGRRVHVEGFRHGKRRRGACGGGGGGFRGGASRQGCFGRIIGLCGGAGRCGGGRRRSAAVALRIGRGAGIGRGILIIICRCLGTVASPYDAGRHAQEYQDRHDATGRDVETGPTRETAAARGRTAAALDKPCAVVVVKGVVVGIVVGIIIIVPAMVVVGQQRRGLLPPRPRRTARRTGRRRRGVGGNVRLGGGRRQCRRRRRCGRTADTTTGSSSRSVATVGVVENNVVHDAVDIVARRIETVTTTTALIHEIRRDGVHVGTGPGHAGFQTGLLLLLLLVVLLLLLLTWALWTTRLARREATHARTGRIQALVSLGGPAAAGRRRRRRTGVATAFLHDVKVLSNVKTARRQHLAELGILEGFAARGGRDGRGVGSRLLLLSSSSTEHLTEAHGGAADAR